MKKAFCMIVVLTLVLAFVGCSKQENPRTLYSDAALTVTRTGNTIQVADESGSRCTLTLRRTRKRKSGMIKAMPIIKSDALTVETLGDLLHIVKDSTSIYIKM